MTSQDLSIGSPDVGLWMHTACAKSKVFMDLENEAAQIALGV